MMTSGRRSLGTCFLLFAIFLGIEGATKTYNMAYSSGSINYAQYNLYNDKIYVHTTTSIVFNTKGKNDCHLLFKRDANDYYNNVIEIVIGGWSNTQSVLRNAQQGTNRDTHKESGILSSSTYRTFWISWANSCIKVGKGSTVGSSEFMSWCGLSHAINYLSIGYGFGSAGYFQFTTVENGNWGSWGSYATCSRTCATGSQSRSRACNNPAPSGGGADCAGSSTSSQNCNTQGCPVAGSWGSWAAWGTCTCDSQSRTRSCDNPAPQNGGSSCSGSSSETNQCTGTYCPVSCRDVYTNDVTLASGLYTIYNSLKEPFSVYCVFQAGFGYTYIYPKSPVDIDVSNLISINSEIYIRQLKTDNTQIESRITQLARYRTRPMSLQYNKHDGYQGFINNQMTPYLYLGMLPIAGINHRGDIQGYAVNGVDQTFTNCDGNPNGYFVFLFNQNNVAISNYNADSTLVRQWNNLATATPTDQYLPNDFFTFLEVHFGGCGGYVQSDRIPGLSGAAIGIRYDVACSSTVPDVTRATKTLSGNIHGETVTYTCTSPYTVVSGDAVHTCLQNGNWEGTLPTCGLNGGWSAWSSWDTCSLTCGSGSQGRTRTCTDPAPLYGGATCAGSTSDQQNCNTQSCPIDGGLTSWSSWSTCTVTCGTGGRDRSRTCTNPAPQHGGASCTGALGEQESCNTHNCPIDGAWATWSSWTTCTLTCGSGVSTRTRACTNPAPQYQGADCPGSASDQTTCNTTPCPIDGGLTSWSSWSTCTVTCGTGGRDRSRTCTNPAPQHGGATCTGALGEQESCNTHNCPIDGAWTTWSSWDTCTLTCGSGVSTRTRACTNPAPQYQGADCPGSASDQLTCNTTPCPVDGGWSYWSRYSSCSVTCLGGVRNRTRTCDNPVPAHGGASCAGSTWETGTCNNNTCDVQPPVDGNWGVWAAWQGCSVTCGTGVQRRYRSCDDPVPNNGGQPCGGTSFEENACTPGGACPVVVNGGWSAWSTASSCSATCGDGRSMRVRYCNNPTPSSGGSTCSGDAMVMSTCNLGACAGGGSSSSGGTSYAASYFNVCPVGMFSCKSGLVTCIDESFVCDCDGDCFDGSDETTSWANCDGALMANCESAAADLHGLPLVALLLLAASVSLIGPRM